MQEEAEPTEQAVKVATAAKAKPWSAAVLASYLNSIRIPRIAGEGCLPRSQRVDAEAV